jgi:D-inositol-3-phosphate glycosyltransferase
MKRLAFISYHTCPLSAQEGKEVGGMNIYVLELAKELTKNGYSIDIFTRDQGEKGNQIVTITENMRVIHITAGPQETINKKDLPQYLKEFTQNTLAFIQKENIQYHLCHAHYYLSGMAALSIVDTHPMPLVMTFHTLALMKNLVARSEAEKESQERIRAEHELMQKADSVISPSETDSLYMQYLYGADKNSIMVITPGVNTHIFYKQDKAMAKQQIGADVNHKLLLFVGRIEPLKGIDVLLYALKIVKERNSQMPVCLYIVGGDVQQPVSKWSEELQKLDYVRATLGLTNTVKFLGRKTSVELPYYYNAAELVIAPSQYESFGMTALEAMACGTPVITTDVMGIADLLDSTHESLITSANNPMLLAEQIELLLTDNTVYEKVSTDVREKVQDLDWEKVAERIKKIYEKIIIE